MVRDYDSLKRSALLVFISRNEFEV